MNDTIRTELIQQLGIHLEDEDTAEEAIEFLDTIGAINAFWAPAGEADDSSEVKVPDAFKMISPMYQGDVVFATLPGGKVGYKDALGHVRIMENNRAKLWKKVQKYSG